MANVVIVQPGVVVAGDSPPNPNLYISILSCVCCNFCCLGLVALICALQSNSAGKEGKVSVLCNFAF